jgi:hypothetical protein
MRWLGLLIVFAIFAGITGVAYVASAKGWGLPAHLDKPVSVRDESEGHGRHTGGFFYFGETRRHSGGGFHGGK